MADEFCACSTKISPIKLVIFYWSDINKCMELSDCLCHFTCRNHVSSNRVLNYVPDIIFIFGNYLYFNRLDLRNACDVSLLPILQAVQSVAVVILLDGPDIKMAEYP